ncbi:hypothetical protein C8R43DRAFT_1201814 [Mycena crocata]|nr:hypothetical protein C8R43DRAFT_1201814 [Mycena crocata]
MPGSHEEAVRHYATDWADMAGLMLVTEAKAVSEGAASSFTKIARLTNEVQRPVGRDDMRGEAEEDDVASNAVAKQAIRYRKISQDAVLTGLEAFGRQLPHRQICVESSAMDPKRQIDPKRPFAPATTCNCPFPASYQYPPVFPAVQVVLVHPYRYLTYVIHGTFPWTVGRNWQQAANLKPGLLSPTEPDPAVNFPTEL